MSRQFSNGTSDMIAPGSGVANLTGDWTISAWIKRFRPSDNLVLDMIWSRWTNSTTNRQLAFYVGTEFQGSRLQLDVPFIAAVLTGDTVVTDNVWHNVMATRVGNVWSLYLDGVLDGSTTNALTQETGGNVELGASTASGTGYTFDGRLAYIAAWDVGLSSTERGQIQNRPPAHVRSMDLVGAWNLQGASPEPDELGLNDGVVTGTSFNSDNPLFMTVHSIPDPMHLGF